MLAGADGNDEERNSEVRGLMEVFGHGPENLTSGNDVMVR